MFLFDAGVRAEGRGGQLAELGPQRSTGTRNNDFRGFEISPHFCLHTPHIKTLFHIVQ